VPQAKARRGEGLPNRHHVLGIRPFLTWVSPSHGSLAR
jgi:hypothetical protein